MFIGHNSRHATEKDDVPRKGLDCLNGSHIHRIALATGETTVTQQYLNRVVVVGWVGDDER